MGNGYSWSALVLGMVGMLLFRVLLITAVVAMIKYARGTGISSECRQERISLLPSRRVIGTRDVPGKPELFATTKQLLDDLNLRGLNELPALQEISALLEPEAAA